MKKLVLVLVLLMLFAGVALAADIALQPVESSLIAKAGYDAATQTLAIQLVNSLDVYHYQGVPQAVYDGFLAAESKGSYFVKNIKGQFPTAKAE